MSFIAKNPLTIPKVASAPPTPQEGARGLFAGDDGWYDIDSDGNVKKIALSDDNISYADCDNDLKTRIDYSLYDDHFVAPTPQEDFVITYRSIDNTASIHAYVGNDTDIVVPYICYKDGAAYIVTALQPESFQNHDTIVSVALPNTITRIDAGAFLGCSNLSSINIPNGVNLIASRMFSGCESLTSIIIPANVRAIATLAFYGCTNLATITMHSDISVVGDEAFWGCHALTTVYYNGNKKQWSEMTVGDDNDAFLEATIVYSMRDYALSDDLEDVRRQLSRVYKPKGSCASLPTQNNQIGDVWNLLYPISAGSIQLQATKNETIIVPTSRMTYSSEHNGSYYSHTFSILFLYEEFPEIHDSNYRIKTSGLFWDNNKVSLTMEGISFDSITYEDFHISPEEDGYKIVFREYSQSAASEFQRVASEERTVTQIKIPHENRTDFPSGSNVVWVEPGYWDVLTGAIDLSGYVALNDVTVTNKDYAGAYIKHAKEVSINTKKAENLVTAGEVDDVLVTEFGRINNKISGIFHYKGSCELSDLPSANNVVGDVWNISGVSATSGIQIEVDTDTPFSNFTCDYNYNEEEAEPSHQFQLNLPLNTFNHIPLADGQDEPDNYTSLIDEDVVVTFGNGMTFSWLIDSLLNVGTHLSINFEAEDGESVWSVWSQIHEAKTQDPTLEIEHISIPYKYIGAVKTGDNFVWAEPGYWDTLSNSVDLSSYVTKDSTDVITNKAYAGDYIKHMTEIKIDNKTANNLVTADEVDSALSTEITRINNLLGSVFHYKGTCAAYDLPTSNNVVGDVWNLLEDVDIGDIQVTAHLVAPTEIEASSVGYSYAPGRPGFNRHLISFNLSDIAIQWILDTTYDVAYRVGVTLKIDNYTFNTDTYEDYVVSTEAEYITFYREEEAEYGEDSVWKSIADNGGTITQLDIPYENKKVIPAGSNVAWAEPGYWDMLAPTVDLSGYVAINNVSVTDKNYSGDYIKHAREINISTKKAENLVTAEEIDNVLSTEIQKINSKFGGVFHYKGSSVVSDLPKSGNTVGDVWNISEGGNTQVDITSSSFVVPYGDVDYDVELQDGVYHHTFWFNFDFGDIDYIGENPGWHFSQTDFENIRVKVHNYEPLKYVEDPGGLMEPIVDLHIEINDFSNKLSLTFSADSESATYSNWQEIYNSGTSDGLQIDFVITPYISDRIQEGDNIVWAEPGYWDTLSNSVDLSGYATKSYVDSLILPINNSIQSALTEGV